MDSECARTRVCTHPAVEFNPGGAGEAHWELWGWTEASLSCSAGGAAPQHDKPVIITNTLREACSLLLYLFGQSRTKPPAANRAPFHIGGASLAE